MTFAVLRALHAIIGTAIDDIERVYAQYPASGSLPSTPYTSPKSPAVKFQTKDPYASPPPTPGATTAGSHFPLFSDSQTLDFPSLDEPYDPSSPSEVLTSDPMVTSAISRVVSAAGQLAACTQNPFLTLCDASMGYHLPSCLRLLEASHAVEILREAGKEGLHVSELSRRNGVERGKLAHILRLLCTHHILRELRPDVFALNRISSLIDSGKKVEEIRQCEYDGRPEAKYHDTDGIAAFVGLCTDELQKASAYLTEAYLLSPSPKTRSARDPTRAPFSYAFGCVQEGDSHSLQPDNDRKEGVSFFGWLEGEGYHAPPESVEVGRGVSLPPAFGAQPLNRTEGSLPQPPGSNANRFRLERFGKAMTGTCLWDTPGGVLSAFPWQALPRGSVVVDVGGGIGSTTMLLASAFASTSAPILPPSPSSPSSSSRHSRTPSCSSSCVATMLGGHTLHKSGCSHSRDSSTEYGDFGLKFIIQDRGVVCEMGEKAWREQCPSLLDSGAVKFQVHDFFTAQPIRNAAVFFLRVILHDWPDSFAQRILLRLREAAKSDTKLVIADFVLPLACADDMGLADGTAEGETRIEGAESRLAPAPLLANLGKSSAIAYWMDLTMQVTFNGQERTLREVVALTASAGWKVTKVVHTAGSLFGYLIAEPVPVPISKQTRADSEAAFLSVGRAVAITKPASPNHDAEEEEQQRLAERASSRCGTPTFGSRTKLPSLKEAKAKLGLKLRNGNPLRGIMRTSSSSQIESPSSSKGSVLLGSPMKKKKPSPLATSSQPLSPSPIILDRVSSPRPARFVVSRPSDSTVHILSPPRTRPRGLSHAQSHYHLPSAGGTKNEKMVLPTTPTFGGQHNSPGLEPLQASPVLRRRASHAHMTSPPSLIPSPMPPVPQIPSGSVLGSPVSLRQSLPRRPPLGERVHEGDEQLEGRTLLRKGSSIGLSFSIRKRSGTISGPSSGGTLHRPDEECDVSPLTGAQRPGDASDLDHGDGLLGRGVKPKTRQRSGSGIVLAAAARFERALHRQGRSSPS